jgi:hypothetical protein|tara:strand:- start:596 stop:856 length:261 start_codon:yes stop_codon:yes gene_type:complete
MPNYKVVLFTDSINQQYMTEQQQAINNSLPDLAVEVVNYTDSRFAKFSDKNRVPCIMVFKDEARMQTRHSKLSHSEAVNWITTRVT